MSRADPRPMIEQKALFEQRTEMYRRMGFDRIAVAEFVAGAAGHLEGPALDIGTGKGTTAMALARRGLEVVSVDTDAEAQAFAAFLAEDAGLGDRIRFVCGDAASLAFPDGTFGCIASMDALHHFVDPRAVLAEMARLLQPAGTMILADFTPEGFDLVSRAHRQDGREHPVLGVTLEAAEGILATKGMRTAWRMTGHHHDVAVLVKAPPCGGD